MSKQSRDKRRAKRHAHELPQSRVKIGFKRHIMPPLAGLLVTLAIFGFFNSQLISGKLAYYFYSRHAVVANLDNQSATAPVDKNAPPKITINKINVTAPVLFDQTAVNQAAFQKDLHNGVVHYPDTAVPGQMGNVVIFGHSSGQWWAPGNYKFVFTLLNKLQDNDRIFIDYQGTHYIYRVIGTSIVQPTDLSVLNQGTENSLTLITCTPVGTSAKRLIIHAQQIVPAVLDDRNINKPATQPANATGPLPGNSSSFWHDLRSLF